MGLMDKLKAAKSSLTGDWANVTIQFEPVGRGGTMNVTTDVTVKNTEISIDGVVIEVRCQEKIDIPNATVWESNTSSSSSSATGRATSDQEVVEKKVSISGPLTLAAGSTSTYKGSIEVPSNAPPTLQGRYARYEWQVRARLEMKGNDPDSGWQSFQVD
jgi:hypothetical protein